MILRRIFEDKKKGFYVDIGAHHPKRFSNTHYLYKRGWSGINVDAVPGSMIPFNKTRGRDINIEAAISNSKGTLDFYIFNEPALNTFSKKVADKHQLDKKYLLIKKIIIETKTLSEILSDNLPVGQNIDFFTVDVEGYDLRVLESNDWNKYRPEFVLVECLSAQRFEDLLSTEIYKFFILNNYSLFAKTVNTCFFKDDKI
jgi:FkbM family methyltransferase